MSQIEVTKLPFFVSLGPDTDEVTASRVTFYASLSPDTSASPPDGGDNPIRQAFVSQQIFRNAG